MTATTKLGGSQVETRTPFVTFFALTWGEYLQIERLVRDAGVRAIRPQSLPTGWSAHIVFESQADKDRLIPEIRAILRKARGLEPLK